MPKAAREIPWLDVNDRGVYAVFWYDAESRRTKRVSLKTEDAGAAKALYAEFLLEKAAIDGTPSRSLTVRQALADYYAEHVVDGVRAPERQKYAIDALNRHVGDLALFEVDVEAVKRYTSLRGQEGVQDATVRRELSTLRAAANHAFLAQRVDTNSLPRFKLPADTTPRADKWLSKEQFAKLHAAAEDEKAKRFIWLAYWTGARKGVLHVLTKQQIDWRAGHMDLHPPGRPRTKKRNPVIRIPSPLSSELATWCAESETDYVLGSPTEPRRGFDAAVKAAGLEALGVSPHWLRHSRISHMLQDGVSIFKVARFIGDTPATIDRVYGHMCPDDIGDV